MELAFKLDGQTYEVAPLTLDDAVLIDREFGVRDITEFEWTRPAYLAALVYLGFRDKNRHLTHSEIMDKVGKVDLADLANSILEAVEEKAAKEADPPKAATAARAPRKTKPSSPAV